MKILVTGAKGFVGKNMVVFLQGKEKHEVLQYDLGTPFETLNNFCRECDFVLHFAGINRPITEDEFMSGNYGFTGELLDNLKRNKNSAPIIVTSSIQATNGSAYGNSKLSMENLIFDYQRETGTKVYVYRLPNIFGKWCKPNYNSAVATFCYNIARGIDIKVKDPEVLMNLVYIDDIMEEFLGVIDGKEPKANPYCSVSTIYKIKLGEIPRLLYSFKEHRKDSSLPRQDNLFIKKLYATYLSYLPSDELSYPLKMNIDQRGSFSEFLKTKEFGQVSVNISKPNIIKGNHYHHTKNEKFLVVSGEGVIRFKHIVTNETKEYYVSGKKLEVVEIPSGYTHNIENLGNEDLVTIMWASENFDPDLPDTYYKEI